MRVHLGTDHDDTGKVTPPTVKVPAVPARGGRVNATPGYRPARISTGVRWPGLCRSSTSRTGAGSVSRVCQLHGHVVSVREGGGPNAPCSICGSDGVGNAKKVIRYVAPEGRLVADRWETRAMVVCRIGKACRGRAYDKQVARKVPRRRTP